MAPLRSIERNKIRSTAPPPFAFDMAGCLQALAQRPQPFADRRLLRACRERPRRSRAAEKRDELAPFQLIELHSIPASQGRRQDIQLVTSSQRVSERLYNL
jgi:hypothetical protein